MSQDLIKSVSIDALLARRDSYLEKMEAGLALMREAGAIGTDLSIGRPAIDIEPFERAATTSVFDPGAIELLRSMADANAWHYLLRESGLYTFMDRKSRGEWKKMIDRRDVPPLTRDNIEASFSSLYESRQELLERGVIECFRSLSWNYKTNSPWLFGKRVILSSFARYDRVCGFCFSLDSCRSLDDLIRVFHVYDNRPEPDHRDGVWAQLHAKPRRGAQAWRSDYLSIKWFKKGTCHVEFLRPDLVEKLNGIIARRYPDALPADCGRG